MTPELTTTLAAHAVESASPLIQVVELLSKHQGAEQLTTREVATLTGLSYPKARGALATAALAGWVDAERIGQEIRWFFNQKHFLGLAFSRLFIRRNRLQAEIGAAMQEVKVIETLAGLAGLTED